MPATISLDSPVTVGDLAKFREELLRQIKELIDKQTPKQIVRFSEAERRSGLAKSTLQQRISTGTFPAPIDLGGGRGVGFLSSEIDAWIEQRVRESRRNGKAARHARAPRAALRAREPNVASGAP